MPMKKRLDTSNERSLLGTSLAAETSFQQFFWNQRFKPGFLESVEAADTSGSPPFGRSLASLTQHPKWAGEIAINCFQIRSLARSSQRVVSGKCPRHPRQYGRFVRPDSAPQTVLAESKGYPLEEISKCLCV